MSTYLSPVFPGVAKVTEGILVFREMVRHGSCKQLTGFLHVGIIVLPRPCYITLRHRRLEATLSGVTVKSLRTRVKDLVVRVQDNRQVQFLW